MLLVGFENASSLEHTFMYYDMIRNNSSFKGHAYKYMKRNEGQRHLGMFGGQQ